MTLQYHQPEISRGKTLCPLDESLKTIESIIDTKWPSYHMFINVLYVLFGDNKKINQYFKACCELKFWETALVFTKKD